MRRLAFLGAWTVAIAGCQGGEAAEDGPSLFTVEVRRGNLLMRAEATGTVEPVREVEVKSKASGEILVLHHDVGDEVTRGTLLAEIDPRDVRNRYDQVEADLKVARARIDISEAQLERSNQLFAAEVITQQDNENAFLDYTNSQASLVRAETNFELAELQMMDVRIRAPMDGTIIQKNVEEGGVIQSASQNVSGGTVLFVMADLSDMQVRTLVDETDMGQLEPGMVGEVMVEAFPDLMFEGIIEKIEPWAVVQQNVTMFPVIVSLDNSSGLLKVGMNVEVEIFIDEALDVLLVPNVAIVKAGDVGPAALALGLDIDELDLSQFERAGGRNRFAGGFSGGRGGRGFAQAGDGGHEPAGDGDGSAGTGGQAEGDPMAKIQSLRAQVESGEMTEEAMRAAMQEMTAQGGGRGSGLGGGGFGGGPGRGERGSSSRPETRPGAVFVLGPDGVPEPRFVELGAGDWEDTQIVSGVEEGDVLVIVGAAQLQAQQQEYLDRMRDRMSGGNPFGGGMPGGRGGFSGGGRRR